MDNDGCPDTAIIDSDGDGVQDELDMCPTQSETWNRYMDHDGCPDDGAAGAAAAGRAANDACKGDACSTRVVGCGNADPVCRPRIRAEDRPATQVPAVLHRSRGTGG